MTDVAAAAPASRLRTTTAAAALACLGAAAACWMFLPHFLDPAPLAAAVLFVTSFVAAGGLLILLRGLGRHPSAGVLAVLVAALAAAVGGGAGVLVPPQLAAGSRFAALWLGLTMAGVTLLLALATRRAAARAPAALAALALVAAVLGSVVAAGMTAGPVGSVRCLLVGLDGMTWKVMKPLHHAGDLPTVSRLVREGAVGTLESEDPTVSPRVWTTIATGKTPSRHRILDFETPQSALRAARIWEILEGEGRTVGVFGYLVTWPPGRHRGFLVPGWEARGPEAAPSELAFVRHKPRSAREALAVGVALVRHGVRLGSLVDVAAAVARYRGWTDAGYSAAAAFAQLALESDVFLHLLRTHRPEFAVFVASGSDTVSHLYWRYMDARNFPDVAPADRARYGDVIPDYYRAADRVLARLLERVPREAHTVVVSDHGNGPLVASRRTLSVKAAELVDRLGVGRDETSVTMISGAAHFEAKSAAAREALRRKLEAVRWARSGAPVFEIELLGDAVVKARALAHDGTDTEIVADGRRIPAAEVLRQGRLSGDHTRHGVFLATGPRILRGVRVRNARIRDVTPTLLTLFDLPVADDMDGRPIEGLLAAPSAPPGRIASWDHHRPRLDDAERTVDEDVEQRLKALGYM